MQGLNNDKTTLILEIYFFYFYFIYIFLNKTYIFNKKFRIFISIIVNF